MKSRYLLLAGALLAGAAHAVPHYGPGPGPMMAGPYAGPQAPQSAHPAAALRTGMDKLLDFLGSEPRPSQEALASFLDQEIAPFFDFQYMAETAGGRLFAQLGSDEQAAMVEDVKRTFLGKMAEKLAAYDQQQVRFLPPRRSNDPRTAQVSVAILNPGSYPARLDFRLYRSGDAWRVYDVAANGQSAIVHYRQELMRQVQQQRMQQMRAMMPQQGPMMLQQGPMGRGMPPRQYGPVPMR